DDVSVLSIDLRLEPAQRSTCLHDAHELLAPRGLDVKLLANVLERGDDLVGGVEPVYARERRVGVEILPVGRRAKDALDGVLEQAVIAALRLAQRLLLLLAVG